MKIECFNDRYALPAGVRACTTLAAEGFDLGGQRASGGALSAAVLARRERLRGALGLERIAFLEQVHGIDVHEATGLAEPRLPRADAVVTSVAGVACAVLTADCLPVLFCSRDGSRVAAAHAGWRGLAAGVLEATVEQLAVPADQLLAVFGAAIGPDSFEVGPEVRSAFLRGNDSRAARARLSACFKPGRGDRWWADLYGLARVRLEAAGVTTIFGGDEDCLRDNERWFSYRRDGTNAGRQASLIWIELSRSS